MRRFGLIGRPLGHSASAAYFTEKFNREGITDCEYSLYELGSIGDLPGLLERLPELCGLNVTIPYKRDVMAFLDSVSPEAEAIGAVNCIRRTADGGSLLAGARWNLIPAWSDTDRLPYPTFNARVESAADKPTFRDAARHGRILIPMLGYYEWDAPRTPYWFHARDNRILLAAGLLSIWRGMPTCSILTRRAEGRCAEIHDRMPVVIPPSRVQCLSSNKSACRHQLI